MVGWRRNIGATVRQRLVEANHQARTCNASAEQSTSIWRIRMRIEGAAISAGPRVNRPEK